MDRRVVREVEFGVVQSAASEVPPGFALVVLPELPVERLMHNVLIVEHEGTVQEHLVLGAHFPKLDEGLFEDIRRVVSTRWPGAQTSFVIDHVYEPEGPTFGCAVNFGQAGQPAGVAAAVAEWVRRGTLDDVETVSVAVDGVAYRVAIRWAGTHAEATIFEGAG